MGTLLNVLIAEDRPADVKLVQHALRRAGFDLIAANVDSEADFRAHLTPDVDIVLSDYAMQQFDAERALALVKESGLDLPFIVVTGTISETVAVEMMKQGAADYLLKDRMGRLGEAVRRALEERDLRRGKRSADQRLRESEQRFGAIISSAMDAIITTDEEYRVTLFNAAAERVFGCPAREALGRSIDDFIPERFRAGHRGHMSRFGETSESHRTMRALDVRGLRVDGEEFPAETSISQACIGETKFFTVILRDVSERKHGEEALRQSEERYRLLFDSNPQPMWVYDVETLAFLAVNTAAVEHYGYTRDEFLKMTIWDIRPNEDWPRLKERLTEVRDGESGVSTWRHRKKGGGLIDVEIISHGIDFDGRAAKLVLATDITERRFLEEQLRQAQKMEAIGRLAGGVAHDFNNLLTAIIGYSQLLMVRVGKDNPLHRELEEIYKAGARATSLTSQLLAFSRKQMIQPVQLSLNAIVAEMDKMLKRLLGEDVELRSDLAADLGWVKADAGQMQQVLMNLAVNARDAMPRGGRITIETANVELDESFTRMRAGVTPGPYVLLAVADTGCGMDYEIQSRIFEPFFTTKEKGKGTGLGLSTIHGIVSQNGGHVWFTSEPGRGTRFEVFMPRIDQGESLPKLTTTTEEPQPGTETVLLVEDEEAVRTLAREILRSLGYTVLEAADCRAALEIVARHAEVIDLLVTDVVMPQMSGRELAERVLARRGEIKILYISGHTDDAIVRHGVLNSGIAFLQKPFLPRTLAHKVREVLQQQARSEVSRPAGD